MSSSVSFVLLQEEEFQTRSVQIWEKRRLNIQELCPLEIEKQASCNLHVVHVHRSTSESIEYVSSSDSFSVINNLFCFLEEGLKKKSF